MLSFKGIENNQSDAKMNVNAGYLWPEEGQIPQSFDFCAALDITFILHYLHIYVRQTERYLCNCVFLLGFDTV